MSDLRKAAEMALSVLDLVEKDIDWLDQSPTRKAVRNSARALRQALAQPEQDHFRDATKKVEWVGLTDEEIEKILEMHNEATPFAIYLNIEAKLKEKNGVGIKN